MPIFRRHKVMLEVLLDAPRVPTRTELMKWIFLIKQETELRDDPSFYEFVPYKYGPFSFTVYRDLDELSRFGYLNGELRLRPDMLSSARENADSLPGSLRRSVRDIMALYGPLPQPRLISKIYERYPWFASKSELQPTTPRANHKARPAVFTAGYEGESIEAFFQKLLKAGIERVVDVRNNPVSRKYGFSKLTMDRLSKNIDLDYVHLPSLGIPPEYRRSLNTFDDYQDLMKQYEQSFLPHAREARAHAATLLRDRPSALVCFEADVRCCHRSRLASTLSAETGLEVRHL
jgi:hypothetical protein